MKERKKKLQEDLLIKQILLQIKIIDNTPIRFKKFPFMSFLNRTLILSALI